MEQYNLIENRNGFEECIGVGTRQDLERMRSDLELENASNREAKDRQDGGEVAYYVVPKREWDLEHCPLLPVDFS